MYVEFKIQESTEDYFELSVGDKSNGWEIIQILPQEILDKSELTRCLEDLKGYVLRDNDYWSMYNYCFSKTVYKVVLGRKE